MSDADPPTPPERPPSAGEQRERVWTALMRARAAAYPLPPSGHHPNFRGAGEAAALLVPELLRRGLRPGGVALCFPDHVLKPVRKRLLEAGVTVVVPAKHGRGWRRLEPGRVRPASASSIAGAEREGEMLDAPPPEDVRLAACVAVARDGARLSKGYGFRFPEGRGAPVAAIVHPLMEVEGVLEPEGRLALWATPEALREPAAG